MCVTGRLWTARTVELPAAFVKNHLDKTLQRSCTAATTALQYSLVSLFDRASNTITTIDNYNAKNQVFIAHRCTRSARLLIYFRKFAGLR